MEIKWPGVYIFNTFFIFYDFFEKKERIEKSVVII